VYPPWHDGSVFGSFNMPHFHVASPIKPPPPPTSIGSIETLSLRVFLVATDGGL